MNDYEWYRRRLKKKKNPSFQINAFWQKSAIALSVLKLQNHLGDTHCLKSNSMWRKITGAFFWLVGSLQISYIISKGLVSFFFLKLNFSFSLKVYVLWSSIRERHYRLKEDQFSDTHRNGHTKTSAEYCWSPWTFSAQQVLDKDHADHNYRVHIKKDFPDQQC